MINRDRQILEYRPRLQWRVNLLSAIEEAGISGEAREPQIPAELQVAVNNPASEVVQDLVDLIERITKAMDELGKCLTGNVSIDGTTFEDYKQALIEQDWPVADAYENFHANHVNGKMQAEAYSVLNNMLNKFIQLRDSVSKDFLDNNVDYDNIDAARARESKFLERAIILELKRPGEQDLLTYAARGTLLKATREQAQTATNFIEAMRQHLTTTIDDEFGNDIGQVIAGLVMVPDVLPQLETMNELVFTRAAKQSQEARDGLERLSGGSFRQDLTTTVVELTKLRTETVQAILLWLSKTNIEEEFVPLVQFLNDTVMTAQEVDMAYQNQILDLYKANRLDELQKNEYLGTLRAKKRARMSYHLVKDIQAHFDFADDNTERQIRRFVQNRKLNIPRGVCYSYDTTPLYPAVPRIKVTSLEAEEIAPELLPQQGMAPILGDLSFGNYRIVYNPTRDSLDIIYTPPI